MMREQVMDRATCRQCPSGGEGSAGATHRPAMAGGALIADARRPMAPASHFDTKRASEDENRDRRWT